MNKILIGFLATSLLIPLGMWWFSPDQVVMRRTKHLMKVLTLSEGTGAPLRQAKVFSMNAMLASEVELVIPEVSEANGTFEKMEIESALSWICQNAKHSRFDTAEFRNVNVDGETATVNFLAEGYLELAVGRPVDGIFDVTIVWKKGADGWRYDKVVWKKP